MRSWIQNTKIITDLLPVMQTRMQILQYIRLMRRLEEETYQQVSV